MRYTSPRTKRYTATMVNNDVCENGQKTSHWRLWSACGVATGESGALGSHLCMICLSSACHILQSNSKLQIAGISSAEHSSVNTGYIYTPTESIYNGNFPMLKIHLNKLPKKTPENANTASMQRSRSISIPTLLSLRELYTTSTKPCLLCLGSFGPSPPSVRVVVADVCFCAIHLSTVGTAQYAGVCCWN